MGAPAVYTSPMTDDLTPDLQSIVEAMAPAESNMTVDEVKERVRQIDASKGDDEGAHSMEDTLRADVLKAIADGAPNAAALAAEALKTMNIDFARWCA